MGYKQKKSAASRERSPNWQEQWIRMVDTERVTFDPATHFPKLDKAILTKARKDPEALMTEAIGMMVASELRILMRTQLVVSRWLREWDKLLERHPEAASQQLADAVEEMVRIEDHLTDLMTRHARLRHVAGLAEETKTVQGTARKLQKALRVVAHPVAAEIEAVVGSGTMKKPLEKAG